jgi:site-specific recombinase XerD
VALLNYGTQKGQSFQRLLDELPCCQSPLAKRGSKEHYTPSPPRRPGAAHEESEVARLTAAAAEGRNRALLKRLYVSGVRVSERYDLKWCGALARQDGGQIAVFGKGGKTRTVLGLNLAKAEISAAETYRLPPRART